MLPLPIGRVGKDPPEDGVRKMTTHGNRVGFEFATNLLTGRVRGRLI